MPVHVRRGRQGGRQRPGMRGHCAVGEDAAAAAARRREDLGRVGGCAGGKVVKISAPSPAPAPWACPTAVHKAYSVCTIDLIYNTKCLLHA